MDPLAPEEASGDRLDRTEASRRWPGARRRYRSAPGSGNAAAVFSGIYGAVTGQAKQARWSREAVTEELEEFLNHPPESEVADAKQAFVEAQKVGQTSDAAIAGQIVSNLEIGRSFGFAAGQEKAILTLTPAKIAEAFRKYIDPQRLVILRAGDFRN